MEESKQRHPLLRPGLSADDDDDAVVLVADRDGEVIGYVYATLEERSWRELRDACGFIDDVVVRETERRAGVATALMVNKKNKDWAPVPQFLDIPGLIGDLRKVTDAGRGKQLSGVMSALAVMKHYKPSAAPEGLRLLDVLKTFDMILGLRGDAATKKAYGNEFTGLLRSSFLIDEEGRLSHVWYRVSAPDTYPKALEALEDEAA